MSEEHEQPEAAGTRTGGARATEAVSRPAPQHPGAAGQASWQPGAGSAPGEQAAAGAPGAQAGGGQPGAAAAPPRQPWAAQPHADAGAYPGPQIGPQPGGGAGGAAFAGAAAPPGWEQSAWAQPGGAQPGWGGAPGAAPAPPGWGGAGAPGAPAWGVPGGYPPFDPYYAAHLAAHGMAPPGHPGFAPGWPGYAMPFAAAGPGVQPGAGHPGAPPGAQAYAPPGAGAGPGPQAGVQQLIDEIAQGGNGLNSLTRLLSLDDSEFWKGALIGAAAVLLLTNDQVQDALFKSGAKAKAAVERGAGRSKERAADEDAADQGEEGR